MLLPDQNHAIICVGLPLKTQKKSIEVFGNSVKKIEKKRYKYFYKAK